MQKAPNHKDEEKRINALQNLKLLDTKVEERFDKITKEAVKRFSVPISTITLVDKDREWFKSVQGLPTREGPRDISFCSHALVSDVMMIVEDASLDPRFSDNPMVIGGPNIRFYAGKSLYDKKTSLPVGVFCIKDNKPRKMSLSEISDFLDLANKAEDEINRSN